MLKSVELFVGAGGLGMGLELSGFQHKAVLERDRWCCDTIRENQQRANPIVADWPLHECDVREFDYASLEDKIDLVSGGPPCQPFSMGGKHGAYLDNRDMFPITVDVIRRLRPRAFIVENVRGLTRPSFNNYFQYILLRFEFPEIVARTRETWTEHLARLEREKTSGRRVGLSYDVIHRVLNAADFGIPQKRERVFIVGLRSDLDVEWSFPEATHSHDALRLSQWITNEYWDRHRIGTTRRPSPSRQQKSWIEKVRRLNHQPGCKSRPWRTVRDALFGLEDPERSQQPQVPIHNHQFQHGARVYKGHTGSPLDLPAKTLKAGDHGVPGGENMMVKDDGTVRYFTVRESARLQTFPDGYILHGTWSECMRQLGNAVPVELARLLGSSIAETLLKADEQLLVANASDGDTR